MESGVVQHVQVGFGAHHDVPHVRELVVEQGFGAVSYTHLTLPTILLV